MTIEEVNEMKRDHCRTILTKLDELKAEIESHPELWFGGLPPMLIQIQSSVDFQKQSLTSQFGLE